MRALKNCTALFFDGSSAESLSRLFSNPEKSWIVHGDELDALSLLRTALIQIDNAARHEGVYIALSLSYETSTAFISKTDFVTPLKIVHETHTPWLQALAFKTPQMLNRSEALQWLQKQGYGATTHFTPAKPLIEQAKFIDDVERIRALIEAGESYQVNLTFPLSAELLAHSSNPDAALASAYHQLVAHLEIPYGSFLNLPHNSILSASPELFFELKANELTCRPMKGTAAATSDPAENLLRAIALERDKKNRAENLMIVDLMRNDLSRLIQTQQVSTPKLFEVKPYGSVLQMSSTIKAHLKTQPKLLELFESLFPCGSITGAPKRRAMEIIEQLEPYKRGIYCGAIGFIEPDTEQSIRAIFSVPIRTIHTTNKPIHSTLNIQRWPLQLSVGAGITYDSNSQDEWQESLLKAQFFIQKTEPFELIETLRIDDQKTYLLNEHLTRLRQSIKAFGWLNINPDITRIINQVRSESKHLLATQPFAILRLGIQENGTCSTSIRTAESLTEPVLFRINDLAVDSSNPFLQYKTTVRAHYNTALIDAKKQGLFDFIFMNEKGELTEGARSNLFLLINDIWYTPPAACGLLSGIQRHIEIKRLSAQERVLYPNDLKSSSQVILCNSIYGALEAKLA